MIKVNQEWLERNLVDFVDFHLDQLILIFQHFTLYIVQNLKDHWQVIIPRLCILQHRNWRLACRRRQLLYFGRCFKPWYFAWRRGWNPVKRLRSVQPTQLVKNSVNQLIQALFVKNIFKIHLLFKINFCTLNKKQKKWQ